LNRRGTSSAATGAPRDWAWDSQREYVVFLPLSPGIRVMAGSRRTEVLNHPIIITFLIFAVIGFMSLAAEVLKPLALAILLSFALAPLTAFLERRGLPRAVAVVLTILLALGVLGGITYKVGQQLT